MRPAATGATRTRVTRTISADPTSTALLLAGPAAVDLWPGVRRIGEAGGRVLVEADLPEAATAATVRALPPQRTPTSFVTKFAFVGPSLPATEGELTLAYAPGAKTPATAAVLTLDSTDLDASALSRYELAGMAERFLDNLARAAEERNRAA
jgi:hypothetical protein